MRKRKVMKWRPKEKEKNVQMTEITFSLQPFIKHSFTSNDLAWQFALNHFQSLKLNSSHAVVFDIDDTLLKPGGVLTSPFAFLLYKWFVNQGVRIYIVTARPFSFESNQLTRQQLVNVGIVYYNEIYFLPTLLHNVGQFKEVVRRQVGPLLFSVGDQWTDMVNRYLPDAWEQKAYWLENLEPHCKYALKLIPRGFPTDLELMQAPISAFNPPIAAYLDSIFESMTF